MARTRQTARASGTGRGRGAGGKGAAPIVPEEPALPKEKLDEVRAMTRDELKKQLEGKKLSTIGLKSALENRLIRVSQISRYYQIYCSYLTISRVLKMKFRK